MNSGAWICEAPHSTQYQLPFLSCLRDDRARFMENLQAIKPLQDANDLGLPFDVELMPDRLFWGRKGRFDGSLPPLFHNAFTYLRADLAELFLNHSMGQGCLRTVELFQNDTVTPLEQKVYALVIGNAQETLDYDSSDLEVHRNQEGRFILPLSTTGKTFRVRPGFQPAADVWADPRVSEGFFLSDRLVQALTQITNPNDIGLLPVS